MIARHQGHVRRRPERFKPSARRHVFARQRDVDQVAGHRDVVAPAPSCRRRCAGARRRGGSVGRRCRQLEKAGGALAEQLGKPRPGQRPEMRVGQMGKGEHARNPKRAPTLCPPMRCVRGRALRAADQDAGEKHQRAADHHLERGRHERRVHVPVADIRDRHELDRDRRSPPARWRSRNWE